MTIHGRDRTVLKELMFKLKIFGGVVVFCGALVPILYFIELKAGNPDIHEVCDAAYLLIMTIATVGYGDVVPVTPTGKFIVVMAWFITRFAVVFAIGVAFARFGSRRKQLQISQDERLLLIERELKEVHAVNAELVRELKRLNKRMACNK